MTTIPTLETERLWLRGWRESDLDRYFMLRGDPTAAQFIGGAVSRDDAWRSIATILGHQILRGYSMFALEEKSSGNFVGYCGPWFPVGWPEPEFSWGLVPSEVGKGFMTEAAKRALAYAFGPLGWTTAISLIVPENVPSAKVAHRLGAKLEGSTEFRGKMCGVYRHARPTTGASAA